MAPAAPDTKPSQTTTQLGPRRTILGLAPGPAIGLAIAAALLLVVLLALALLVFDANRGGDGSSADDSADDRADSDNSNTDRSADPRPDIILINLDDVDLDLLGHDVVAASFPNIDRHLQQGGLRLDNLHVVDPLCGPSRASLFRGQYAHNTGIELNYQAPATASPTPTGSWAEFLDQGYTHDEVGVWMQAAGYTTMLIGKYHHTEFPTAAGNSSYVPPGWNDFRVSQGSRYFATPRIINGVDSTTDADEFRTDVEGAEVLDIIGSKPTNGRPRFIYLAPFAAHGSPTTEIYAPRHADLFSDATVPRTPDFNEADPTDKPSIYDAIGPLTADDITRYDEIYRDRLRSMMAVDEFIGELFDTLATADTPNTIVMLTSDNGFQLGHHRLFGKKTPYDRSTRVGLLVAGPGITPGRSDALLAHIDIAPTLLDLAEAPIPALVDGRSFAPLLRGDELVDRPDGILIENREPHVVRGALLEMDYAALRTQTELYIEHANGDREYYDLATDPFQLDNTHASLDAATQTELANQVERLRRCAGGTCHGEAPPPELTSDITSAELLTVDGVTRLHLTGTATASTGVPDVEITIRSELDNRYWRPADEATSGALTDGLSTTTIAAARADDTGAWSFDAELPTGFYWVSAVAIDTDGNRAPRPRAIRVATPGSLDPVPLASIDHDITPVRSPDLTPITGGITPRSGAATTENTETTENTAASVFVRVMRIDTDFPISWDGRAWVNEQTTWVPAQVDGNRWTLPVPLDVGRYRIHAYASDDTGATQSWDHGRPSVNLLVD